jgi:hypothetical protein
MAITRRDLVDIGALSAMLADRIDSLCAELLPAGTREGHEWRIGSVAGERGRSMAVHLSGPKPGCGTIGRPISAATRSTW